MIKIVYVTVANVRLTQANFTVGNIPTANIENFEENARKNINTLLGITTDLTATEVGNCNAEQVALLYCAIDCCDYDPATLFTNTSEYAMQLDAFYAKLGVAKRLLMDNKGPAIRPTAAQFTPISNSE